MKILMYKDYVSYLFIYFKQLIFLNCKKLKLYKNIHFIFKGLKCLVLFANIKSAKTFHNYYYNYKINSEWLHFEVSEGIFI